MVTYPDIVAFVYPAAVAVTDYYFAGGRLSHWNADKLGPEPAWDEATQTYPALEVQRAACESALAAKATAASLAATQRQQAKSVLSDMLAGNGTTAVRLTRLEQVLARVVQDLYA